jgi:Tol biopolymer transport system component
VALVVVLGQGEDYYMEVQVMNIDGSEARLVTDMGYYFDSANWSPDGQYFDIFGYLNNQAHSVDARLWIVSLDGSVQTDIRQYFDLPNVVWRP